MKKLFFCLYMLSAGLMAGEAEHAKQLTQLHIEIEDVMSELAACKAILNNHREVAPADLEKAMNNYMKLSDQLDYLRADIRFLNSKEI